MKFLYEKKEYTLAEIRRILRSPVFRVEDGYRDEGDFLQMHVGVPYHAYLKNGKRLVGVIKVD